MNNVKVRWGASYNFRVEMDDDTATLATMYLRYVDGGAYFALGSASFVDGVATIAIPPEEMELDLGDYHYQINVDYAGGGLDKFPDADGCEDCELPTLTVCEAVDTPNADDNVSS